MWFATGQDIKEADGVMIMYSVASTASLQEAVQMKGYVTRKRFEREMEQTESNASIIPLILVGVDHGIKKREIPWEDGTDTHTHTHTQHTRSGLTVDRRWCRQGGGAQLAVSIRRDYAGPDQDQQKLRGAGQGDLSVRPRPLSAVPCTLDSPSLMVNVSCRVVRVSCADTSSLRLASLCSRRR
jgi:hypothetical protein